MKIGRIINEDNPEVETAKIFNKCSTRFYRLLVASPLVMLFVPTLWFFGVLTDGEGFPTVLFAVILALWIWYIVATNKLMKIMYWAKCNDEDSTRLLRTQLKWYVIIDVILSTPVVLLLSYVSLNNNTFFFYPYTWLFVVAITGLLIYVLKEYRGQRLLLAPEPVEAEMGVVNVVTPQPQNIHKAAKPTKRCPYCGEEILAVAKKCKHCGEWIIETKQSK